MNVRYINMLKRKVISEHSGEGRGGSAGTELTYILNELSGNHSKFTYGSLVTLLDTLLEKYDAEVDYSLLKQHVLSVVRTEKKMSFFIRNTKDLMTVIYTGSIDDPQERLRSVPDIWKKTTASKWPQLVEHVAGLGEKRKALLFIADELAVCLAVLREVLQGMLADRSIDTFSMVIKELLEGEQLFVPKTEEEVLRRLSSRWMKLEERLVYLLELYEGGSSLSVLQEDLVKNYFMRGYHGEVTNFVRLNDEFIGLVEDSLVKDIVPEKRKPSQFNFYKKVIGLPSEARDQLLRAAKDLQVLVDIASELYHGE